MNASDHLPEAPAGMFWRIGSVMNLPEVQLRRRRRFGSALVDRIMMLPDSGETTRSLAQHLLERNDLSPRVSA